MRTTSWLLACLGLVVSTPSAVAEITLENPRFRAVLRDDAVWQSLVDKTSGNEFCAADKKVALATTDNARRLFGIHG